MTATQRHSSSGSGLTQVLFMALELSWNDWKLAFAPGAHTPPRHRQVRARDLAGLLKEIAAAKKRFGLDEHAAVVSCYEAGRDGFWLQRWLSEQGVANLGGGCGQHRGESAAQAGQDGSARCVQALDQADPVLRRRSQGVERGERAVPGRGGSPAVASRAGDVVAGA